MGKEAKLAYIINEENETHEKIQKPIQLSQPPIIKSKPEFETYLNSRYTFDNFIKGEGNQLARAAASAISDNPGGTSFNPFFVYGGVGLGKTHYISFFGYFYR